MSNDKDSRPEAEQNSAKDDEENQRFHRRGFFTEGFRQLLRPLADIVEDRLSRMGVPMEDEDVDYGGSYGGYDSYDEDTAASTSASAPHPTERTVLRPPGALRESEFVDRCLGSGQCIHACPVSAIRMAHVEDPYLSQKPYIEPRDQACVVCNDLACMQTCPSGALVPVSREEIRMGRAVVREDLCLRTQGEDCRICVDKCPVGQRAIDIPYEGGPVLVYEDGCVGCGVCEMYCPVEPKAIEAEPVDGFSGDYPDPSATEGSYAGAESGDAAGYAPKDLEEPDDAMS